jgi:polar amino acid transport system substrate-binding protein
VSARLTVAPGSEERWESVFLAMTDVSWVREVRERERRLIDADKMASLGQLAAGFAHEISNPNQAIALCGQVLEDAWPDISGILDHHAAEAGDYSLGGDAYSEMRLTLQRCVSSLASSSRRIQATVDALKQFALLEDDEAMIPTEVNLVVQAALRLAAPLLRKATEKAEVTLGAGMPRVMGRPRRLEQVVLDLVKNACQALPERSRALAVRTYAEDGFVILEVEDQGIGMDADELRRAREPFYTTRRAAGGLGLGLSTAHDIVTQHAGRMDIRSIAGKGTCVVVRLPGAAAEGAT